MKPRKTHQAQHQCHLEENKTSAQGMRLSLATDTGDLCQMCRSHTPHPPWVTAANRQSHRPDKLESLAVRTPHRDTTHRVRNRARFAHRSLTSRSHPHRPHQQDRGHFRHTPQHKHHLLHRGIHSRNHCARNIQQRHTDFGHRAAHLDNQSQAHNQVWLLCSMPCRRTKQATGPYEASSECSNGALRDGRFRGSIDNHRSRHLWCCHPCRSTGHRRIHGDMPLRH